MSLRCKFLCNTRLKFSHEQSCSAALLLHRRPRSQSTAAGGGSLGGLGALGMARQRPLALQDIITPEGVLRSGVLEDQEGSFCADPFCMAAALVGWVKPILENFSLFL